MEQKIMREIAPTKESHQLHDDVLTDMGDDSERILLPLPPKTEAEGLSHEDRFNLAAYAAVINRDPEEDELWERTTHDQI